MFFGRVKGEREGDDDDSKFPPPPTPPPPEEEADSILAALAKVMGNQEITHIADVIGDLLLPCSLLSIDYLQRKRIFGGRKCSLQQRSFTTIIEACVCEPVGKGRLPWSSQPSDSFGYLNSCRNYGTMLV